MPNSRLSPLVTRRPVSDRRRHLARAAEVGADAEGAVTFWPPGDEPLAALKASSPERPLCAGSLSQRQDDSFKLTGGLSALPQAVTTVVISQPMLFPWPGFFEQMAIADIYFWLDDAQFSRGGFTNRTRIVHSGSVKWLSIPLAGKGAFQTIADLSPAEDFRPRHAAFLRQALAGAPYFALAMEIVDEVYARSSLCDLLVASAEVPAARLGLPLPSHRARTSASGIGGDSWRRVLDLVLSVGGTRYVTGHGAADYLDHEAFEAAGVAVEYMSYSKTPWRRSSAGSSPFASILDLVANVGEEAARYLRPTTVDWRKFVAARGERGDGKGEGGEPADSGNETLRARRSGLTARREIETRRVPGHDGRRNRMGDGQPIKIVSWADAHGGATRLGHPPTPRAHRLHAEVGVDVSGRRPRGIARHAARRFVLGYGPARTDARCRATRAPGSQPLRLPAASSLQRGRRRTHQGIPSHPGRPDAQPLRRRSERS